MPKQRRIALKIYEWVEKGLYFHKTTRKKIVLSTLEPRTANLCFIANGLFSHSLIYYYYYFNFNFYYIIIIISLINLQSCIY